MEEGGGSSSGMCSDLPMIGHGGTVPRVEGVQTLDLEEYIMEDTRFMGEHIINMEVRFVLYIVEDDSWGYQIGFVLYILGEYMLKNMLILFKFYMQWLTNLQTTFDEWLPTLDNELVLQDGVDMLEEEIVAEMDGVEDIAPEMEEAHDVHVEDNASVMEGIEGDDVEMVGEEVHQYDLLTTGEQVIFDVMFDIYHPNFYLDDNGLYCFREE
jgi:hypothetical protein